ncbi:zinc metalloprotease [Phnomibacter sp. MR]|uniref:zinc metalloprotease n=1 Tax=Phnomibacter sp. MR TaxID=3042318 RepID=UPI003A80BDFF
MKRIIPAWAFLLLALTACEKSIKEEVAIDDDVAMATERRCDADLVLSQQLAEDPSLKDKLANIESFTNDYVAKKKSGLVKQATVTIPVVVNVLYRTAAENVSDAQIQSQIDVLNRDFNATNTDFNSYIPAEYAGLKANVGITFTLQAVVRKATNKTSWRTNDDMKKSTKGGINPTSPSNTLNIWVCTLSNSILGYAQFPGGSSATDGVVILNRAFGTTGTAAAPFNLGRTATHEVGHWANLRHIWGDATCGNDQVTDTPPHNTANYGCPAQGHKSTCTGTPNELWMNYMDYTDDRCMYMFSTGQKDRMLAVFAAGGPRAGFSL